MAAVTNLSCLPSMTLIPKGKKNVEELKGTEIREIKYFKMLAFECIP